MKLKIATFGEKKEQQTQDKFVCEQRVPVIYGKGDVKGMKVDAKGGSGDASKDRQ